jgi:hypothetical protein
MLKKYDEYDNVEYEIMMRQVSCSRGLRGYLLRDVMCGDITSKGM